MCNKNKWPQILEEETAVHFSGINNLLWLEKHQFYRNFCKVGLMFEFMLLPSVHNDSNFFVFSVKVTCLSLTLYLAFNSLLSEYNSDLWTKWPKNMEQGFYLHCNWKLWGYISKTIQKAVWQKPASVGLQWKCHRLHNYRGVDMPLCLQHLPKCNSNDEECIWNHRVAVKLVYEL